MFGNFPLVCAKYIYRNEIPPTQNSIASSKTGMPERRDPPPE